MCPDGATTTQAQHAARPAYEVFEGLELITFIRAGTPLYLGVSEQLWLPEEWPPGEAPVVQALRAITAVDGRPVPWLWRPGGYIPCRSADVLVLLGGSEPGRAPRGFRCSCGRLERILCRLPSGPYVCQDCQEAGGVSDGLETGGHLLLEEDGRSFLIAEHPTRYAPDRVPFEVIWECWRGQN